MSDNTYDLATAREDLCRFLSACYYEPTIEFEEEHLFDSMLAAATRIDPELAASARRLGEAFRARDLQTLLVDHTRLFVGPMQPLAMPFATFWLDPDTTLRHEATDAVLELYELGGFEVSDDFGDLPDHIAVELEFLYALTFALNPQRLESNAEETTAMEALRRRFVTEHLAVWIGSFTAVLREAAETEFYRELAALTEGYVRLEVEAYIAAKH